MENQNEIFEYETPEVTDYGTLEEMTLQNGSAFTDVGLGTPNGNVTGSHA